MTHYDLKLIVLDIPATSVTFNYIEDSSPIQTWLLNDTDITVSRLYPIRLRCGYQGMPILPGTTFAWFKDDQPFGPIISESASNFTVAGNYALYLDPGNVSTTLILFKTISINVYGQYRCNISTYGQSLSVNGSLIIRSDYQLAIVGNNSVIEGQPLQLHCMAKFILGRASGLETFSWFQEDNLLLASKSSTLDSSCYM